MLPNQANMFLPILDNWEEYFQDPHEGLGTTYERFLLHELFSMLDEKFTIESVLEVPSFGMTGVSGINSLWWAQQGKQVVVLDDNKDRIEYIKQVWADLNLPVSISLFNEKSLQFEAKSFDLVWNFAALWFVNDLADFSNQLKRIARQVIFICVPNMNGIGFRWRLRQYPLPEKIRLENIEPNRIKTYFSDSEWELWKTDLFDVPPWPDIPLKKEELVKRLLPWKFKGTESIDPSEKKQEDRVTIIDYFSGANKHLQREMKKYRFLERSPEFFRNLWGHHRYFIFKRKQ
ncbi:MAG: class I SAM-dependent methyltransferase [Calditrichaeota bacterium]|nr:MAG: class I SAM-dependent methyltransferase [Calditrichota bacterium]